MSAEAPAIAPPQWPWPGPPDEAIPVFAREFVADLRRRGGCVALREVGVMLENPAGLALADFDRACAALQAVGAAAVVIVGGTPCLALTTSKRVAHDRGELR